jgi:hypothetical protein
MATMYAGTSISAGMKGASKAMVAMNTMKENHVRQQCNTSVWFFLHSSFGPSSK